MDFAKLGPPAAIVGIYIAYLSQLCDSVYLVWFSTF
jgi:hypothetical protein